MHKFRIGLYKETDPMSYLITDNYPALLVLSRFRIALGFGDKNIGEVCSDNGVDCNTFLAVINLMVSRESPDEATILRLSLKALMDYLRHSHDYFLHFRLPEIRLKLSRALNSDEDKLNGAVLEYFDKFVAETRKHMLFENRKVFPHVVSLLNNDRTSHLKVNFKRQHGAIELRLSEFKSILIKYYPARNPNEINSVLFDIFSCEKDLGSHNAVEDLLFLPAIELLEKKIDRSHE